MNDKILVTYASRAGSTAGVAEAIGKTLIARGLQVDVIPMQAVKDITPYRAVVAGSAIRGQKWLPEAMQFLSAHRSELSRKPFAAFMVCITLSMANADQYLDGLKSWMSPVRDLVHPISEGYFAGALDFSKLPFSLNILAMRFVVLLGVWKQADHRDWTAIRAWAESPVSVGLIAMMDTPCIYEIRVKGTLADRWSEWFEGLQVHIELNGETTLRGELIDQSALFGVLIRIHSLNLELLSVSRSFLQ